VLNDSCSSDSNFSADEQHSPKRNKHLKHLSVGYLGKEESYTESMSPLLKETNSKANDLFLIPPPENLIAKSVIIQEPIRTGAPIAFVKTDNLTGEEKKAEFMGESRGKAVSDPDSIPRSSYKNLADELVKADKEGKVVYCRFGKQYIANLEKQMNSILNTNSSSNGA
jgi:hypothetical protein